ncbi:MAG TPA: porin [Burkholderiales bacterium]|nr:porin [Burkholderiales bacterium]
MVALRGQGRSSTTQSRRCLIAAAIALAFGASAPAQADMETLLDTLRQKGVLSEEEYQEMRKDVRAERRAQALEKANQAEKDAKRAESAPTELTGRFKDGFSWSTGDGQNAIAVTGRVHADYRTFSNDSTNANAADTFDIRRAYIGLQGKIAGDWTFDVTGDFGALSANSHLDVAWINYGGYRQAQFRAGQFKMPMSVEELTSSRFIDFQERSMVNAFVPGKERGAMLHGEPVTGLYYAVAASNGAGKNTNEGDATVDDKDYIARLAVNAAEMIGNKDMVLHAGGSFAHGNLVANQSPVGGGIRTEGRGMTFFQTANVGAAGQTMDRTRSQLEASLAWNNVKLQGEWITTNYETQAASRDIEVYYAEAMWLITGEKYADAYRSSAYSAIKPNRAFKRGADGWGAWEVGVRYTSFDAGDFVANAGFTNKADAVTVGLKWIPNTNTRVMLNYVDTSFDTPVAIAGGRTTEDEQAITMRLALYF